MTVIAACTIKGVCYIGGDTLLTGDDESCESYGSKLLRLSFGWVGVIGNIGQLQILNSALSDVHRLKTLADADAFTGALRRGLDEYGWRAESGTRIPRNDDICFIVATNEGKLFTVEEDLIPVQSRKMVAGGSGVQAAMGAMHAAIRYEQDPAKVVRCGVNAAKDLIASCGGSTVVRKASG